MKKTIEYIKNFFIESKEFYQEDTIGFIGGVAIYLFLYFLLWHICPIILGL